MINFANKDIIPLLRSMWKVCFGDTDEYINIIFSEKFKEENTLVYFVGGKPVASLQMQPYIIKMYHEKVPFYYFVGLCTLPEYRGKGYMSQLIMAAFDLMKQRDIPLAILVPAEHWLYNYYSKFCFTQTFEQGTETIDLRPIAKEFDKNKAKSYNLFDKQYQQKDFTVLKTEDDFATIIREYVADGQPLKTNLGGMSYIGDIPYFLSLYSRKNPNQDVMVKVKDLISSNITIYHISSGKIQISNASEYNIEADQTLLTKLIFGYKLENIPTTYRKFFKEHQPTLNLMLE